jgi:hypothetical protein
MSFLAQGGYSQDNREKLEKAVEAREQKYGYTRGANASLTKPKQYESIADADFADPVGYNYPVDKAHIHGAIGYWQHMEHRGKYKDPKARAFITERIVKAALKFGVAISWDPKDPDYQNLPLELKKQMEGYSGSEKSALTPEGFRAFLKGYLHPNW